MSILRTVFCLSVMVLLSSVAASWAGRKIPVYPGSILDVAMDQSGECCDFSTADSLGKVAAFYRTVFGGEPMGIEEAAKRYPALMPKLAALKKEIPAGAQFKALALPPVEGESPDAPALFELYGMAGLVNFTIAEGDLAEKDVPFAAEFRARTGRATIDEKAQMQKLEDERAARAKTAGEDKAWRAWLKGANVPLYPDGVYTQSVGPVYNDPTDAEKKTPLLLGIYESYGLYEKIRDFYGQKLKEVSESAIPGRRALNPFTHGGDAGGRSYTSKSRAGQGRAYFAGPGCVDVAIVEGRGGEGGQKITRIIFDIDPACEEAKKLSGQLFSK